MRNRTSSLPWCLRGKTLIELAQEGVPQDVPELLDEGEPEHGVRPAALRRALLKAMMDEDPADQQLV